MFSNTCAYRGMFTSGTSGIKDSMTVTVTVSHFQHYTCEPKDINYFLIQSQID